MFKSLYFLTEFFAVYFLAKYVFGI